MPRTWRAGGIIGPTTAKQNAGAGGVEVWSLERYELEKQKELLVILMKKLERYELEKQQNAGAGGVEVWSLERYELEKQKKSLIKLPEVGRKCAKKKSKSRRSSRS